jgi:LacI family gluconate utilization system Gnt-I transcriptional repressor
MMSLPSDPYSMPSTKPAATAEVTDNEPAETQVVKPLTKALATTLVDVARVAGVAPITVSRVMTDPDKVKATTLEKVRRAIEETGYVPNFMAGALSSNRSKLIAVILPTIVNSIYANYVQAVTTHMTKAGYQVLLGISNYDKDEEAHLIATILSRRPEGMILIGTQHSDTAMRQLRRAEIPIVETWDSIPDPIDILVGFSHRKVGEAIGAHLLAKGYRRFGLLWLDDVRGRQRREGLVSVLASHGVMDPATCTVAAPATLKLGREGMRQLLAQDPDIDVIVCSSDELALGVLAEAASRDLRIPRDLGLMGFGDLSAAEQTFPALSTVRINGSVIGTVAAEKLLSRLANTHDPRNNIVDTGFTIVERESC